MDRPRHALSDRLQQFRRPGWRKASLAAGVIMVFSLFYLGAKPFAVGLFPEPWDKLAHFAAFGGIAAFLLIGTGGRRPIAMGLLAATLGALDEIHQIWLPGRTADPADFAADAVGIVAALALHGVLFCRSGNGGDGPPDGQSGPRRSTSARPAAS